MRIAFQSWKNGTRTSSRFAREQLHRATIIGLVSIASCAGCAFGEDVVTLVPTGKLVTTESRDQDDMCVWVHPDTPARSTVITSDKSANRVFVYDLAGELLQTIEVAKPGNIDLRQKVTLDGKPIDIIVVNQRTNGFKLAVFRVDSESRKLTRIDEDCLTGPNYGGCLYHSPKTGQLYFVCTSDKGSVEQYRLDGNGQGVVKATKVRTLAVGKCEGAIADDATATLYISEERRGVWKFDAEPDGSSSGSLIAAVGENALKGDVEGLAIYKSDDQNGYLLVSDQGINRFKAYQRRSPHAFVGEFQIDGASQTDGIEICQANLGPQFPAGLFACHTDRSPRAVLLTPWSQIANKLAPQAETK